MVANLFLARWGLMLLSVCGAGLILATIAWISRRNPLTLCCYSKDRTDFRRAGMLLAGFTLLTLSIQFPGVDEQETALLRQVFRVGPESLQHAVKRLSDIGGFAVMSGIVAVLALAHWVLGRREAVWFFLPVMIGELALE